LFTFEVKTKKSNDDVLLFLAFDGHDDVLDELSNDDFLLSLVLERLRESNIAIVVLPRRLFTFEIKTKEKSP
jgi:hypothetical protein